MKTVYLKVEVLDHCKGINSVYADNKNNTGISKCQFTEIFPPTEEEIEKTAVCITSQGGKRRGFIRGVEWVINKITGQ
jgi:hypothetical protein